MIKCTYENSGNNTLLVYKLDEKEELEKFNFGMISNNTLNGVAPILLTQINKETYIKYNVSSKIALKLYFDGIVKKEQILKVFLNIIETVLEAEEYMIDADSFYFDVDYLYVNVSTLETSLICFPVVPAKESCNIFSFMKNIMASTKFDSSENTSYVASVLSFFNSNANPSLLELKALLESQLNATQNNQVPAAQQSLGKIQQAAAAKPVPNIPPVVPQIPSPIKAGSPPVPQGQAMPSAAPQLNIVQPPAAQKKSKGFLGFGKKNKNEKPAKNIKGKKNSAGQIRSPFEVETPVVQVNTSNKNIIPPNQKSFHMPSASSGDSSNIPVTYKQADFGETTVLGNQTEGETTVLNDDAFSNDTTRQKQPRVYLVRAKNNEKIPVQKETFKIGKEKTFVDYFIGDNSYISRCHANFTIRQNEYFVIDNNSRNHTYINGRQITGNTEEKVVSGDKILLANEEFTFIVEV